MKIQKLLGVCAEHLEENNAHQVGAFEGKVFMRNREAPSVSCGSKLDGVVQAVAALGIALISMGEEVGAEMSSRSFEHMLQYGEVISSPAWRGFCGRKVMLDRFLSHLVCSKPLGQVLTSLR
jgi:26S proteasome regulatory subunit N1